MPARLPRGVFITFEGGDGSGKSTQARKIAAMLHDEGYAVWLTQEPSGTALGSLLKSIFEGQARSQAEMGPPSPLAEMFLFQAARAEHVQQVIQSALQAGQIVLCDRFTDSTLAYQGYGRQLDLDHLRACNEIAAAGLIPDLTLLLDVPPEVGLQRADSGRPQNTARQKKLDSIGQETFEFHQRVRDGYLELARQADDRIIVIDGTLPQQSVTDLAWQSIRALLGRVRRQSPR